MAPTGRPSKKRNRKTLESGIISAFQKHGYSGASFSVLTEETGMIKASLYHRFPKGKEQVAQSALQNVAEHFATYVLAPVREEGRPADRLQKVAARLAEFYGSGTRSCLLETLTTRGAPLSVRRRAKQTALLLLNELALLARQSGKSQTDAKESAEKALMLLEGSLVVARLMGRPSAFTSSLAQLPQLLLGLEA